MKILPEFKIKLLNKKNFSIIANFLIANRQKSGPDHLQLSRSDSRLQDYVCNRSRYFLYVCKYNFKQGFEELYTQRLKQGNIFIIKTSSSSVGCGPSG